MRLAAEVEAGTRLENQAAWCRGVARNLIRRHWERQKSAKVVADNRTSLELGWLEPKNNYLDSANWNLDNLLDGQISLAVFTFCDVPIEASNAAP